MLCHIQDQVHAVAEPGSLGGETFSLYAILQAFHLWPIQVNESFQMLSLNDIRHLDAAEGWLERGQYANCFDELERIDCDERKDGRILAVRWKLYNQSGHHLSAANLTGGIQRDFPNEVTGCVWHTVFLTKPGCTPEAGRRISHQISGR